LEEHPTSVRLTILKSATIVISEVPEETREGSEGRRRAFSGTGGGRRWLNEICGG